VIGESSKNAKGQCFKYQGYGHVAASIPLGTFWLGKSMMMRSRQ